VKDVRSKDQLPARAVVKAARKTVEMMHAVAKEEAREVSHGHVEEYHAPLPGRRYDIPKAVPFQDQHIPDGKLKQMYERLSKRNDESSNEDIHTVAIAYGYPTILVERELARYIGANKLYHHILSS
jgi:hypothetical protein